MSVANFSKAIETRFGDPIPKIFLFYLVEAATADGIVSSYLEEEAAKFTDISVLRIRELQRVFEGMGLLQWFGPDLEIILPMLGRDLSAHFLQHSGNGLSDGHHAS